MAAKQKQGDWIAGLIGKRSKEVTVTQRLDTQARHAEPIKFRFKVLSGGESLRLRDAHHKRLAPIALAQKEKGAREAGDLVKDDQALTDVLIVQREVVIDAFIATLITPAWERSPTRDETILILESAGGFNGKVGQAACKAAGMADLNGGQRFDAGTALDLPA